MKKNLLLSLLVFAFVACENDIPQEEKINLSGLGASFPQPYYDLIFKNYSADTNNQIIYSENSSGAAIRVLKDKIVDFSATDIYLSDKELSQFDSEILHIPATLGAAVLAFKVNDIKEIKLTPIIIANIYLGVIEYWNDPAISLLNPEIDLPFLRITPIRRTEGSGTYYSLSYYLSQNSKKWEEQMGIGKSLKWQAGIAMKSNIGVSSAISNINGAIGCISLEHASLFNLPSAALQNSSGKFIKANEESILAAMDNITLPDDMRILVSNSPNENAYPISCLSWILVYKNQAYNKRSKEKYRKTISFLEYIINPSTQKVARRINHIPLPENVIVKAHNIIQSLEWEE